MEKEYKDYLDNSVFLLKQIKQMLKNHNRMFAITAGNGDVVSASVLLNNNVIISSIDTVLGFDVVDKAEDVGREHLEDSVPKAN